MSFTHRHGSGGCHDDQGIARLTALRNANRPQLLGNTNFGPICTAVCKPRKPVFTPDWGGMVAGTGVVTGRVFAHGRCAFWHQPPLKRLVHQPRLAGPRCSSAAAGSGSTAAGSGAARTGAGSGGTCWNADPTAKAASACAGCATVCSRSGRTAAMTGSNATGTRSRSAGRWIGAAMSLTAASS